jgi:osmoprotectant transport system permease protein
VTLIAAGPTWSGPGFKGNWDVVWYYGVQHLRFTAAALALGSASALVLAYVAHRRPATYAPLLGLSNAIYAIPSLTMFVILFPVFGITNDKPVVVAMALYTLVILLRNLVEGLRSVPSHVVTSAEAMGYGPLRRFLAVELPLAMPSAIAGLRLAAVSTISLISVGGLVGRGGLGRLFEDGNLRHISNELWAGLLAVVVLALAADALLLAVGRVLTPWAEEPQR